MRLVSGKIKMPGAIGRAVQERQATVLKHAVDDGLGEVMVVQDIAPCGERRLVGSEQHRAATLMAFVDDVEQDVGGIGSVGQIANFVDDQNVGLHEESELLLQPALAAGQGESLDQHRGGDKASGEAVLDSAVGDDDDQMEASVQGRACGYG